MSNYKKGGLWWRPSGPAIDDLHIPKREFSPSMMKKMGKEAIKHPQEIKREHHEAKKGDFPVEDDVFFDFNYFFKPRVRVMGGDYKGFNAREEFVYKESPISWFPGHMLNAATKMMKMFSFIDIALEVRDARAPFSSANYYLTGRIPEKMKRIILLNKTDLVSPKYANSARDLIEEQTGMKCLPISAINSKNVSKIRDYAMLEVVPRFKTIGVWMMVLGLPNTGKSSVINALKRLAFSASKHGHKESQLTVGLKKTTAKHGSLPGVTRFINHFKISSSPKLFCVDSPGIMLPKLRKDEDCSMFLAALGLIDDQRVGEFYIGDFILFTLNKKRMFSYVEVLQLEEPSNDIEFVSFHISQLLIVKREMVKPDPLAGCRFFISAFREGSFGRIELDCLQTEGLKMKRKKREAYEIGEPPSPWECSY